MKKSVIFVLSLIVIIVLTPLCCVAEIDRDYDNEGFEDDTTTTTTQTFSGFGGFRSGNDEELSTTRTGGAPYTTSNHYGELEEPPEEDEEESTSEESSSEESSSEQCNHNYVIIGFDAQNGLATIQCTLCRHSYTDYFANHVTGRIIAGQNPDNYDPVFDLVNDGVINGKDYALLMQRYYDDFSINDIFDSHEFLYKEKFGYIYATVLVIIATGLILIGLRRRSN